MNSFWGNSTHGPDNHRVCVEGCPRGELPLDVTPRKRVNSADDARCSSRPPPEGAGSVTLTESDRLEGRGSLCHHCHMKVSELKKQAFALADPSSLKDPGYAAFLFDQLQVPGSHEGRASCPVCHTPVMQLRQEAIQTVHAPSLPPGHAFCTPAPPNSALSTQPSRLPFSPSGLQGPQGPRAHQLLPLVDRRRGLGWPQGCAGSSGPKTSVQVRVGGGQLTGSLGSVTIQAQQYLEGMWSVSRVNNFLPQPGPVRGLLGEPESAADISETSVISSSASFLSTPRYRSPGHPGSAPTHTATHSNTHTPAHSGTPSSAHTSIHSPDQSASAAASFFIRAAQKLNLSSKRKKQHVTPLRPQEPSIYPTTFSSTLQLCPPPAPPCLLRAMTKVKENPGMGKVKVMMRICPPLDEASESVSFLKVDARRKQLTLYDPVAPPHAALRRAATVAVPKIFAFDAVFPQDASQAEVCSGTVAEIIQSVVNGADGCIFCFGQVRLGKTYTMIGRDGSAQGLGVAPCAISWLFKLIGERKEKTGTRFSLRVSAVEISGRDETLTDLLAEVSSGSLQDGQSPGVYLREDPICGTQLQNQSELRAPTAEKAAFFLDAAIAARSTSRPDADEEDRRNSHMLFTLHVYQYRMEKSGKGGMSGGRSRLHLLDLGSCEKVPSRSRDAGGGQCLSLTALGNVIMALANGAKHVPYRDSKLTMLLRDSLGNINCRTTMIAHISDSPSCYADSLSTIQLASRIHRMRKKKSKYASSSSGGDSSCEEGRIRRPPHLRPFHPRTVALDPDLPSLLSDPDYSSSSEQSCDTVIYVGPGGSAVSDRELSDNEGPPVFVPIIPSLNRRRGGRDPPLDSRLDREHFFKCNTFAELQERLECIDGSEEPKAFVGEGRNNQASPKQDGGKTKEGPGSGSPKTGPKASSGSQESLSPRPSPKHTAASQPISSPAHKPKLEHSMRQGGSSERMSSENTCRTSADGEKVLVPDCRAGPDKQATPTPTPEPVVREKVYFNKKPLPKPAPPPPQPRDTHWGNGEAEESSTTRMAPVGMSHQAAKQRGESGSPPSPGMAPPSGPVEVCRLRSTMRDRCLNRDTLRATVTLQQPVELNGEDELVFTVVEELSIGGLVDGGRPTSIVSFSSDCSLQALASGSRPVSIISSINDEFDAYTSAFAGSEVAAGIVPPLEEDVFVCVGSRGSSVSSWLSGVSVSTQGSEGGHSSDVFLPHAGLEGTFYLDSFGLFQCESSPRDAKNSLNDSGFSFSEMDSDSVASSKLSLTKCPPSPESAKGSLRFPATSATVNPLSSANPAQGPPPTEVHSSFPRKIKPTSSIPHSISRDPPAHQARQEDPWQRVSLSPDPQPLVDSTPAARLLKTPASGIPSRRAVVCSNSVPRPPKAQASTSAQRVVDGCEKSAVRKAEPPSRVPQLRRGATTLGTVPVIHNPPESRASQDLGPSSTNRFSSLGKTSKPTGQKVSMLPKPGGTSPPPPPVRKSSLDQKNRTLLPQSALKTACGEPAEAGRAWRGVMSENELEGGFRTELNHLKTSSLRCDQAKAKATSSLKARGGRGDAGQQYGSQVSLERCDSLSCLGSKPVLSRENSGASLGSSKSARAIPRYGIPTSAGSPIATSPPSPCGSPGAMTKPGQAKAAIGPRAAGTVNGSKARSLSANHSKGLSSSTKSLAAPATRHPNANLPPSGKTPAARTAATPVSARPGRGTVMGTKQAMRAANSRVSELALGGASAKHLRGSGESDVGANGGEDKPPAAMLPSPYSKITAPRRPQRYSSGHGSDNSSVLSGELPPAMGRTALFYHSGGSSGYESMIRDSEATGSASSAHDSMSESGVSSSGRTRNSKSPKKRSNGLQRRRLIPAPLPDTSSLGKKAGAAGQWVDLPPTCMSGPLKEPFEIKVYEIDDVERLQRRWQEEPAEQPFQDVEKGLQYFNSKLKVLERRQQQVRELRSRYEDLRLELEDTKARLMMDPCKWTGEFEVDQGLDKESLEYVQALSHVTHQLEFYVNLCKSRVMMVTCFDISVTPSDAQEGLREVEV